MCMLVMSILERLGLTAEDVKAATTKYIPKSSPTDKETYPKSPVKPKKSQESQEVKQPKPQTAVKESLPPLSSERVEYDVILVIEGRGHIPLRQVGSNEESVYSLSEGTHKFRRVFIDKVPWLAVKGLSIPGEWGLTIAELQKLKSHLPEGIEDITF